MISMPLFILWMIIAGLVGTIIGFIMMTVSAYLDVKKDGIEITYREASKKIIVIWFRETFNKKVIKKELREAWDIIKFILISSGVLFWILIVLAAWQINN